MGGGILLIIGGVAIGALMIAAPRGIWLVTESWKYRDPDANEPSEVSYGLTRVGGVLLIAFALIFGSMLISDGRQQAAAAEAAHAQEVAEANFVAPPPEKRGALPVLGYTTKSVPKGHAVTVYYLAPDGSVSDFVRTMTGRDDLVSAACYSTATQQAGADGRVTVGTELHWAPRRLRDMEAAADCALRERFTIERSQTRVYPTVPQLVTTAPVADDDGIQTAPAGAANSIPLLAEAPATTGSRPMRQLRGDLPIVAYEINPATANDGTPKRYLDITYLRPEKSDAHAGSLDGPTGGCDIVPTITGVGTDTVTIGLKLYWSNPNGYYDAEDDAGCRITGSWSRTMTSRWVDVTGDPAVLTDGPLTDRQGRSIGTPAPGRAVPQR